MAAGADRPFRIAHISDVHCGGPYFVPTLLERAIAEINDWQPDLVVCCGDLTTFGYKPEFAEARAFLDRIECEAFVVIPGNHDSRNVGYVHFEEFFGDRNSVLQVGAVTVVAVDSTEPDLDHGRIGRGRYEWIEEQFSTAAELRVFVLHHHLLPVPGTGRERNIVYDAGTPSSACSAPASTSCSRATSTCRTRGGSRTCSSSTRGRCPRCASVAIRGPVTTSSRSTASTSRCAAVPRGGADDPLLHRRSTT